MLRLSKKSLVVFASALVGITSCKKDFLNVNDDPNRVTDENVTAELIFTRAAVAVGDRAVGGSAAGQGFKLPLQFAQDWIGYMAPNGDFSRDYTETSYNIDFGFGNQLWQDNYDVLYDLSLAKNKGLSAGDTVLAGASLVLSAKLFQELVDTYGDIPYTQAFQPNTYPHPAFDKALEIYQALQKNLDTAILYLSTPITSAFRAADVINQGNSAKWIKFANTLKLRLLIRQSEVPGLNVGPEISKIFRAGGVLEAGESIRVNPGYANEVNKQSPFYANYGYTPTGVIATTSYNANAYIVTILSSTNDPRIERFFTPVGSNFVGNAYGDEPGNLASGSNSSYFGPGINRSPDQDQWIYPSFESLFLKAEATARGWIPGDAKAAYEAAVTESFIWLGVPDAVTAATTYMQNNTIAGWANAGATSGEQARFIVFQKYIALTCIDPLEAWADERRLHFLPPGYISANTSRIAGTIPLRLLYPQSEYTTNAESVKAAGTINPFTSKIFWQP